MAKEALADARASVSGARLGFGCVGWAKIGVAEELRVSVVCGRVQKRGALGTASGGEMMIGLLG